MLKRFAHFVSISNWKKIESAIKKFLFGDALLLRKNVNKMLILSVLRSKKREVDLEFFPWNYLLAFAELIFLHFGFLTFDCIIDRYIDTHKSQFCLNFKY